MSDEQTFKESCQLKQSQYDALLAEFNSKKHFASLREAYPRDKEARQMFFKFKHAGLIDKSWKRSCNLLKTNKDYRKQWRLKNKDKMLGYQQRWLNKKFANQ